MITAAFDNLKIQQKNRSSKNMKQSYIIKQEEN